MSAGNPLRLLVGGKRPREPLRSLQHAAERGESVEVLVVEFNRATQRRLTGRRVNVHWLLGNLRDFVLDDTPLSPSFSVEWRGCRRLRELLQRLCPDLAIAAKDACFIRGSGLFGSMATARR